MQNAKAALWLIGGLGLSACGASMPAAVTVAAPQQQGIQVVGEGTAEATPDVAEIGIGVEAHAKSVEDARASAADAQQSVLAALGRQGVADGDVQTTHFNVSPDYQYTEHGRDLLGYVVRHQVRAKLRDVKRVGAVLDAVTAAGGDLVRVERLVFELSDPTAPEVAAREQAVAAARAAAEQLAKLLGVELGAPLEVEQLSGGSPPPVMRMEMAEAKTANTPIAPGKSEVRVQLRVRFAIQP